MRVARIVSHGRDASFGALADGAAGQFGALSATRLWRRRLRLEPVTAVTLYELPGRRRGIRALRRGLAASPAGRSLRIVGASGGSADAVARRRVSAVHRLRE